MAHPGQRTARQRTPPQEGRGATPRRQGRGALEEERRLIEAAQKDPQRFADLYDRYFERVYAFALARTANRTHADELTAHTFHRALEALPRYEWRGVPFGAWLCRIAANASLDQQARAAREAALDQPAVARDDLDAVAERAELFRLVGRLPAEQREVIRMRFAHEHSFREIGRALGRSEGAIKQLQRRALQKLRAWLRESAAHRDGGEQP